MYRVLRLLRLRANFGTLLSLETGLLDVYGLATALHTGRFDIIALAISALVTTRIALSYTLRNSCRGLVIPIVMVLTLTSSIPGVVIAIELLKISVTNSIVKSLLTFIGVCTLVNALGARFALNRGRMWITLLLSTLMIAPLSTLYGSSLLSTVISIPIPILAILCSSMLSTIARRCLYRTDYPDAMSIALDCGLTIALAQLLTIAPLSAVPMAGLSLVTTAALLETVSEGADTRLVLFHGLRSLLIIMLLTAITIPLSMVKNLAIYLTIYLIAVLSIPLTIISLLYSTQASDKACI